MSAINVDNSTPTLFRTYLSHHESPIDCKVWEAARATSAAPTYFKRIMIPTRDGVLMPYIDGGLGRNNPTGILLDEASRVFPDRRPACVVSIGTGRLAPVPIPSPSYIQRIIPSNVIRAAIAISTGSEDTAQDIERRFRNEPNVYFRFNVEQGMEGIKLGSWKRLDEVMAHTQRYLKLAAVHKSTDAAAASILRSRSRSSPTTRDGGRSFTSCMSQSLPEYDDTRYWTYFPSEIRCTP